MKTIKLNKEDSKQLVKDLLNPPSPNEAKKYSIINQEAKE